MTREEAIKILKEDGCGFCTWQSTNPYECENEDCKVKEAFNMAIQALNSLEEVYAKGYDDGFVQAEVNYENDKALSQEPCDDKRLFIKIYADYEPSVVAEKVYQICDEDEFPEVVSRLNAYLEPCDDAISREWLMRKATERFYTTNYFNHITAMIEEAPSVTQKSGRWINDKDDMPTCSECGYIPQYDRAIDDYEYSNYCPRCGAKMESEVQTDAT